MIHIWIFKIYLIFFWEIYQYIIKSMFTVINDKIKTLFFFKLLVKSLKMYLRTIYFICYLQYFKLYAYENIRYE